MKKSNTVFLIIKELKKNKFEYNLGYNEDNKYTAVFRAKF